ncbi:aspartyl protease family protein [Parapedobacter sp. ISTM3]|uniref:Aspartyl protease n=1 Tax=Parapedobacter luteus TaxID=623280 RepID=A0A1T5FNL5_9SPHI|nr:MULTISPECIES: aspartyl protease family protein [Parapedobacter]MBK1442618.1 aspartyl protease family protein [Parapedobacter sp. ISTM3]SKB97748.1 Aspartyl protease [Parapedobacter luteus]
MKALPIIILFVAGGLFSATAQEEYIRPPSEPLTVVPFSMAAESVVLLKAVLVGHPDTLTFILDTGSSGISLDSTTADRLNLVPEESNINIRGIAGVRKAQFLYNKKLKLNELVIDSLNFHINDYEFLSYVYGARIDGVIGYSLFSRYILKIDYDVREIEICSQGPIKYPRGGYLLRPFIRTLPVQSARVRDHRKVTSRFLFDIGAGLSLVLSQEFEQDSAVVRRKRKRFPVEAHGVGGKLAMEMTLVKDFRLGPYRFRKVPTMVFEDVFNVTSYPYLGGLIGNQILKRFNVIFNYEQREIYLKPNTLYREPFEYSYAGMELYYINGAIVIGSIVKGSPADIAGLKEGDVVLAIGNNASQDFAQYKKALMTAKKWLRMIIRRGAELKEVRVRVQSLR